ncbi:MAG: nicotinate phosphoribosyltransferase [Oscillatoriaceae bacterium SKW80]|nr:nicotinate phosphoribosyltransferase [Oscillatoriaceae bacterium SKYG93]MCX8120656.1 nicotinate phosphoribosyltransferase [Oscillatoriaceae bacterium SKW80]MDW8453806.1 nicotinate phosphoribosyltransferase [Oscillatoriaceae cyanobacterium SKYGB_i_bin93]HIK27036.1 nicotinate phosphoribosyltransferase [Oscillatoriaceae cyanobacterium M7585_C2015_266]
MNIAPDLDSSQAEAVPERGKKDNSELTVYPEDYSLLTDLYQLTMAACYAGESLDERKACFELFVRRLPEGFGYLIAMGLAQALEYLEQFRFSSEQIAALQATGIFSEAPERFWSLLATGRFTGDVWAVQEGTAVFANEPLLRVEAPLWQAQIVETYLLNTINYQTLVATRAARLRDVAGPQATLLEFGTRRAFSPQASLWAARAALAAGLDATSNVLAALKLGRKPAGTMAHALVMALGAIHGSEGQAFAAFHHYFPGATLLIDTYDALAAARLLAYQLQAGEIELRGVRLDSGDLVALSREIRSILPGIPIFASGDLDEWEIARLQAEGACIDGYGLGTKLVTGSPVNGVYKLVEIEGIPVMKKSVGKETYPGRKQIFRRFYQNQMQADRLGLAAESPTDDCEQPLLQLVMKDGKRLQPPEPLEAMRERTAINVASLPSETRRLSEPQQPPVELSKELQALLQQMQIS